MVDWDGPRVGSGAHLVACSVALLGVLGACGGSGGKKTCAPKSGQGFQPATFSLQGSPVEVVSGSATATAPRMLGGLLELKGVDRVNQKNALEVKLSEVRFTTPETCSLSLEVRKDGNAYKIDAYTSTSCFMEKLIFRGSSPTVQIFRPARDGILHGYESLAVSIPELEMRDKILSAADALSEINADARKSLVSWGVSSDRIPSARLALEAHKDNPALLKETCLEVPKAVMDAWLAQPEATRGMSPQDSSSPDPRSCQFLVDGDWFTFDVPAAVAAEKKPLLDELVAETASYKAFRAEKAALAPELTAALTDLRVKGRAAYAADMAWRRWQVGYNVLRANCASTSSNARIFCGPLKDAYVDIVKTHILPRDAAQIDEVKASGYSAENVATIGDKLDSFIAEGDKAFVAYANAIKVVQDAMKARQALIGIATNHIRNVDAKQISLVYKDLPLFPADGKIAEELSRHSFKFDNPWLDMAFAKENAHPLVTNLHNEINDGYAITFAGYPVGAMLADTDHSGGASVIALPTRNKSAAVEERGKAEAGTDKRAKRETTTSDGASDGC